jgi:hypothetical protein
MDRSNRDFEQVQDELTSVGDAIRLIVPREISTSTGTGYAYTSEQKRRLAKLTARRDELRTAQNALLRATR